MANIDKILNVDCLEGMKDIPNGSVQLVMTDIPYGEVNKTDKYKRGIRILDKGNADNVNFDLSELTSILCDKTSGSIYMFCGIGQVSEIRGTMQDKGLSTRVIVWKKTNPSPMNGQHIWLSGIELCVYGKKNNATFNKFCANTVLRYPCGERDIHPTQKPVDLIRDLILTSTNEGDIVLDPFMGSGTTAVACIKDKRHFIGFELDKGYFEKANYRIKMEQAQLSLF